MSDVAYETQRIAECEEDAIERHSVARHRATISEARYGNIQPAEYVELLAAFEALRDLFRGHRQRYADLASNGAPLGEFVAQVTFHNLAAARLTVSPLRRWFLRRLFGIEFVPADRFPGGKP